MINAALFACVGVALEVAFTALCEFRKHRDPRLKGVSYVWMFPIYALAYPALRLLQPRVGHWPIYGRGALYVLLLYGVEYLTGWLLRKATGACPWDYQDAHWGIHGLIRLDYAPAWLAVVLIFERLTLQ